MKKIAIILVILSSILIAQSTNSKNEVITTKNQEYITIDIHCGSFVDTAKTLPVFNEKLQVYEYISISERKKYITKYSSCVFSLGS